MLLINKLEKFIEKNNEWNWSLFHGHNQTTGDLDYECRIWKYDYTLQKRQYCKGISNSMGTAIDNAIRQLETKLGIKI